MKVLNLTLKHIFLVFICCQASNPHVGGTEPSSFLADAFVPTSNNPVPLRSTFSRKTQRQHVPELKKSNDCLKMLLPSDFSAITNAYTSSLAQYPLLTKSATGFFLCGTGDVLAQCRASPNDNKISQFNWKRLLRFASKGAFGTLLWVKWYDVSDDFVNHLSILENLNGGNHVIAAGILRTIILILMEQFIACPLIYGFWEIPVATVLNGAPVSEIHYEIKSKLGSMLIENAKIWTWANLLIYNAPVQYRAALGNVMDILWQSIVSDFAADCGGSTSGKKVVLEESLTRAVANDEIIFNNGDVAERRNDNFIGIGTIKLSQSEERTSKNIRLKEEENISKKNLVL
jgi:hypothetical protein